MGGIGNWTFLTAFGNRLKDCLLNPRFAPRRLTADGSPEILLEMKFWGYSKTEALAGLIMTPSIPRAQPTLLQRE